MRKMIGVLIALMLCSCSVSVKPDAEVEKALTQHSVILDAMVNYVQQLQAKGFLPKPEELEKTEAKKSK